MLAAKLGTELIQSVDKLHDEVQAVYENLVLPTWNTEQLQADNVVAARVGVSDFRLRPTRTGFIQVSLNISYTGRFQ